MAKLGLYKEEAAALEGLLSQHFFRIRKRGKWYERLALIYEKYINDKKESYRLCLNAVNDPGVHSSNLYDLMGNCSQSACHPEAIKKTRR